MWNFTTDCLRLKKTNFEKRVHIFLLNAEIVGTGFYDQTDQKNVAIHEFIHILDKQDGKIDGVLDRV